MLNTGGFEGYRFGCQTQDTPFNQDKSSLYDYISQQGKEIVVISGMGSYETNKFNFDIVADDPSVPQEGAISHFDTWFTNITLQSRSWFVPPTTGDYTFSIDTASDAAVMYIFDNQDMLCCDDLDFSEWLPKAVEVMNIPSDPEHTTGPKTVSLEEGKFYLFLLAYVNFSGDAILSISITDPSGQEMPDIAEYMGWTVAPTCDYVRSTSVIYSLGTNDYTSTYSTVYRARRSSVAGEFLWVTEVETIYYALTPPATSSSAISTADSSVVASSSMGTSVLSSELLTSYDATPSSYFSETSDALSSSSGTSISVSETSDITMSSSINASANIKFVSSTVSSAETLALESGSSSMGTSVLSSELLTSYDATPSSYFSETSDALSSSSGTSISVSETSDITMSSSINASANIKFVSSTVSSAETLALESGSSSNEDGWSRSTYSEPTSNSQYSSEEVSIISSTIDTESTGSKSSISSETVSMQSSTSLPEETYPEYSRSNTVPSAYLNETSLTPSSSEFQNRDHSEAANERSMSGVSAERITSASTAVDSSGDNDTMLVRTTTLVDMPGRTTTSTIMCSENECVTAAAGNNDAQTGESREANTHTVKGSHGNEKHSLIGIANGVTATARSNTVTIGGAQTLSLVVEGSSSQRRSSSSTISIQESPNRADKVQNGLFVTFISLICRTLLI